MSEELEQVLMDQGYTFVSQTMMDTLLPVFEAGKKIGSHTDEKTRGLVDACIAYKNYRLSGLPIDGVIDELENNIYSKTLALDGGA